MTRVRYGQEGVALIAVLWVVSVLSMVLANLFVTTRTEVQLTRFELAATRARSLAEAGIYQAILDIHTPRDTFSPGLPVAQHGIALAGTPVRIEIENEAGKIDVNTAHLDLIRGLLKNNGIAEPALGSVLRELEARRQAVDQAGAPFHSLSEVADFLHRHPALYSRIANSISVHSRQTAVNATVASAATLRGVPGLGRAAVEAYISRRRQHRLESPLVRSAQKYLTDRLSPVYTISSSAKVDGVNARIRALVEMSSDPARPYQILAWRETDFDAE